MAYLIGLDVGSTNLKLLVHDVEKRKQTVYSCRTRCYYPQAGWAEYNGDEIWDDLAALCRKAVQGLPDAASIQGIAVASMGEAGLLADAKGQPLTPIIAWFDRRTEAQNRWWRESFGQSEVYQVTGHPIHPSFGVNKLMWFRDHRPDLFSRAAHWLSVEDFVLLKLSGAIATDYSIASRTMAFDIAAHGWSGVLLERAGLPIQLMPPAFPGGTLVGQVTARASEDTALRHGTPVVTGGHDHICASLAVGAYQPGSLLDSTGTSESLILTVPKVVRSPEMLLHHFAQECHVVEGRYGVLAGFPVAGYAVEWMNRLLEHGGIADDFGLPEAARVPPGAEGLFFMPHLRGSGSPTMDPSCRGALVGLTPVHGRGHLLRAAIEGVCYELRSNLSALESAVGGKVGAIFATGKVTQSPLWLQTKADVTGMTLKVPQITETAALGAALLAGLGAGVYATPEDAEASVSMRYVEVEPQSEQVDFYAEQYHALYSKIYPAFKDLYRSQQAGLFSTENRAD